MANQLALETTGHNVTNANTEGYSRQRVTINQAVAPGAHFGPQGAGVSVTSINRIHESFLDRQIYRAANQLAYDQKLSEGLETLQTILNEPGDNSISGALTDFWNSWESLSLRPTDAGLRAQVVEAAGRVALDYNARVDSLAKAEAGYDDEIEGILPRINQLTSEVAEYNRTITSSEAAGEPANDLRDKRDAAVRSLSDLLGLEAVEEGNNVNLRLPDGGPYIVNSTEAFELNTNFVGADGHVRISMGTTVLEVSSGKVGALTELRDNITANLRNDLATMMSTVTDRINRIHRSGYDLQLREGQSIFNWTGAATSTTVQPSSGLFSVSTEPALGAGTHGLEVVSVDQESGAAMAANDYGTLSAGSITLTQTGGTFAGPKAINLDYHVKVLGQNTLANSLTGLRVQLFRGDTTVSDSLPLSGAGPQTLNFNVDGMALSAVVDLGGAQFFRAGERSDGLSTTGFVSLDNGPQVHVDPTTQTTYRMINGSDSGFIAGSAATISLDTRRPLATTTFTSVSRDSLLKVNQIFLDDVSRIATAFNKNPGEGEMARVMGELGNETLFEISGETGAARIGSIVQGVGEKARQAEVFRVADEAIVTQLETQRQSFSGVSIDEEMVLLLQFQRGFEASARFVNIADSMIDQIINRLGRVGL